MPDNTEQVLVNVSDLLRVKTAVDDGAILQNGETYFLGAHGAIKNLLAAIPVPEWEPSEELVERYATLFPFDLQGHRDELIRGLKRLKAEGLLNEDLV
jgi:hypothetical protein